MLDIKEVIKGLQIERECVSRDCDRDCGKCDLVQERDWLLAVYDDAITMLKEQEPVNPEVYYVGPDKWRFYRCPVCKTAWYYKCKYCLECGRPVRWEDD